MIPVPPPLPTKYVIDVPLGTPVNVYVARPPSPPEPCPPVPTMVAPPPPPPITVTVMVEPVAPP